MVKPLEAFLAGMVTMLLLVILVSSVSDKVEIEEEIPPLEAMKICIGEDQCIPIDFVKITVEVQRDEQPKPSDQPVGEAREAEGS